MKNLISLLCILFLISILYADDKLFLSFDSTEIGDIISYHNEEDTLSNGLKISILIIERVYKGNLGSYSEDGTDRTNWSWGNDGIPLSLVTDVDILLDGKRAVIPKYCFSGIGQINTGKDVFKFYSNLDSVFIDFTGGDAGGSYHATFTIYDGSILRRYIEHLEAPLEIFEEIKWDESGKLIGLRRYNLFRNVNMNYRFDSQ